MEYEEIVKQFQHSIFGNLTTIKSFKNPNKIWFLGSEVQNLLGFVNLTQVIKDAKLQEDERFILTKALKPEFWQAFVTTQHVGAKIRNITFISESGLYKLILRSNKSEAEKFANWITRDILPSLRVGVEEDIVFKKASAEIGQHLDEEFQRFQSKRINKININSGGVNSAIKYSVKSAIDHYGMRPNKIISLGKDMGLKSKDTTSSKTVLRVIDKPSACAMSFTDSLVSDGIPYEKAVLVSKTTGKELFRQLLEIGVTPKELNI